MNRFQKNSSQHGFTLIECIIAMAITVVGVLAAASLMDVGMRLQLESRSATEANSLARAKIEQLQNGNPSSTERCQGGYNDTPDSRFLRQWQIVNAGGIIPGGGGTTVPAYTQWVKVAIVAQNAAIRLPTVEIVTLMPQALIPC